MRTKTKVLAGMILALTVAAPAAENFDEAMQKAVLDYTERLRQANAELNMTRTKIAGEKAPLLKAMRAAEDRLIAAQEDITRRETDQEHAQNTRRSLLKNAETLQRNRAYLNSVAQDSLKAFSDAALPVEDALLAEQLRALQQRLDTPDAAAGQAAGDVADFLLARVEHSLGGATAPGSARFAGDNRVWSGTFAFVGPQVYFRSAQGVVGVVARQREDVLQPVAVAHALPEWKPAEAAAFFQGQPGAMPADATAGKALRLQETSGTLLQHIGKGGVVAYAIVGVGLLSLLLILQKVRDVMRMGVDSPEVVRDFLVKVADGAPADAKRVLPALKASTRELFVTGLEYRDRSKAVLEEHLQSVLLRQRLFFERRLPLLAVIATAAPLMGLLGTVVGMVRTFALITVFGTGNAAKLAGGISEVLVATELGLLVAIPTLVAHGFLAHRIHKNLGILERYALEFVTAAKSEEPVTDKAEDIPA
jgi:biopolymer transport protein ExbB